MKVIDCRTGRELQEGDVLDLTSPIVDFETGEIIGETVEIYKIIKIKPGIFKASVIADVEYKDRYGNSEKKIKEISLAVRWTHPSFFLQHIAFLPT